jgi:ribosome-binding factor A
MATHRHERVRELLKRAVCEALRREVPVGDAGLICVNDVELGGDLKNARIFISILGDAAQQRAAMALLRKARPLIQEHVAKEVILKFTPRLRFSIDDSVERGNHVLRLIEELEKEQQEKGSSVP